MNNIRYELFEDGAAISSCELKYGNLTLSFPSGTDGFVRIGARIYKLYSSKAEIDTSELEDGAYTPRLFTSYREYILPGFEKRGKTLAVSQPTSEEMRLDELKLKRLDNAVVAIENKISEMQDMIRTSTLF